MATEKAKYGILSSETKQLVKEGRKHTHTHTHTHTAEEKLEGAQLTKTANKKFRKMFINPA